MKRFLIYLLTLILVAGMISAAAETTGKTLLPLPNNIMEELDNSIVAVSLEQGDAYLDDNGKLTMLLGIYAYDLYDMVDVSMLEVGDTLLLSGEEIEVTSLEVQDDGTVMINGGLDLDGVDLVTDESGVYFARYYNDAKYWTLIGYADFPVSTEFTFTDSSNLDLEEPVTYYPGDFLLDDSGIDYYFGPDSTTVRIEDGMIVAMERIYTP